jgi:enoyl-CoA hydratase
MSAYETLTVEVEGPLAVVTIRREAQRNALSSKVIAELTEAVGEVDAHKDVRVAAITGAGEKAFVSGADIGEMKDLNIFQAQAFAQRGGVLGDHLEASPKVWIAAVNGVAFGGGCELALACDFIYASDRAVFGQPEVKLGVIPGFGGTQRMARRS